MRYKKAILEVASEFKKEAKFQKMKVSLLFILIFNESLLLHVESHKSALLNDSMPH